MTYIASELERSELRLATSLMWYRLRYAELVSRSATHR